MIKFKYNGKLYEVSMAVYNENKSIKMPDGKVINVSLLDEQYKPAYEPFFFTI